MLLPSRVVPAARRLQLLVERVERGETLPILVLLAISLGKAFQFVEVLFVEKIDDLTREGGPGLDAIEGLRIKTGQYLGARRIGRHVGIDPDGVGVALCSAAPRTINDFQPQDVDARDVEHARLGIGLAVQSARFPQQFAVAQDAKLDRPLASRHGRIVHGRGAAERSIMFVEQVLHVAVGMRAQAVRRIQVVDENRVRLEACPTVSAETAPAHLGVVLVHLRQPNALPHGRRTGRRFSRDGDRQTHRKDNQNENTAGFAHVHVFIL